MKDSIGYAHKIEYTPLIIIQPTTFCNLNCSYCYLPDRDNKHTIKFEVLHEIFRQVLSVYPEGLPIEIVWHSGEPLAIGKDFYVRAFDLLFDVNRKYDRRIINGIQTNGVLIDDDWIKIFKENSVQVGISIDGPQFIHDRFRLTRSGKNTHGLALKGMRLLRENDVLFSVIAVLTAFSLDYPKEIFDFFIEEGVERVAFNIDEISGINFSSSYSEASDTKNFFDEYKRFVKSFMKLIGESNKYLQIRELYQTHQVIKGILRGENTVLNTTTVPLNIVTFNYSGDFSTFCPELSATKSIEYKNFVMGNVMSEHIGSIHENKVFRDVYTYVKNGLNRCREECEYWAFCGGGYPSNKFAETGSFDVSKHTSCMVSKQALVDGFLSYLEEYGS